MIQFAQSFDSLRNEFKGKNWSESLAKLGKIKDSQSFMVVKILNKKKECPIKPNSVLEYKKIKS